MKPYLAQIRADLRLMGRDRSVLFFNYLFPLVFFFIFAQQNKDTGNPTDIIQVISFVIVLGILSNGFFGAGMRTVQQRETNVLRRFKVTPAGSLPLIVASLVAGVVSYLPTVVLYFVLASVLYHTPLPANLGSLLLFVVVAVLAFRAVGMILAAVVNSAQESQILIQFLYMPMLFLSGIYPVERMPEWLQQITYFLPSIYVHQGIESIAIRHASIFENGQAVGALLITMVVASFISSKLFRWEKEEKISRKSQAWILAALAPFFVLGMVQAHNRQGVAKEKILQREAARANAVLFNHVRVFVGDGTVISDGAVLIRSGKIEQVFDRAPTDTASLHAHVMDENGRTLLPGMIDMHVHIGAPGGIFKDASRYGNPKVQMRELAAYLYSGITAVRSTGDWLHDSLALRSKVASGEELGAELFVDGPLFTAPGGHPSELLGWLPPQAKQQGEREFLRTPGSVQEARQQVDALHKIGVDGIKAVLEAGSKAYPLKRLDTSIYDSVIAAAQADHLPTATHTGELRDVRDAIAARTTSIEHGARNEEIPADVFAAMVKAGVAFDPTLTMGAVADSEEKGDFSILNSPLLNRAAPADLLANTKAVLASHPEIAGQRWVDVNYTVEAANLKRAYEAGVLLIAGSDAGNLLAIHGPTVQRELELWVQAGVPAKAALQAATFNAAKVLQASDRIGSIAKGHDATLVLVDGDPLQDISVLERISDVYFKGEQVQRWRIFDEYDTK